MKKIKISVGTQAIIQFGSEAPQLYHFISEIPNGFVLQLDGSQSIRSICITEIIVKIAFGYLQVYDPVTDAEIQELLNETLSPK